MKRPPPQITIKTRRIQSRRHSPIGFLRRRVGIPIARSHIRVEDLFMKRYLFMAMIMGTAIAMAFCLIHPFNSSLAASDELGPLSSGFVFEPTLAIPSSHASTVCQAPDGSILCAFYGGSAEAAPDVKIYLARLEAGKWSAPEAAVDTPGKPEGNPVLFVAPSGKLRLYFVTIHGFGWNWAKIKQTSSADSGRTWGPIETLRDKRGWMIRNHPVVLRDGRLIFPMYSENKWCSEFMVSSDGGESWRFLSETCSRPGNIQAALAELEDGTLYATMRVGGKGGNLWEARSSDRGETWEGPTRMELPNPNAGTDMIVLGSGDLLLAFNNDDRKRTPLSLALSSDEGRTWSIKDVETGKGEFSYPSLCQASDGVIHLTYTYKRETIKHLAFTEDWLR